MLTGEVLGPIDPAQPAIYSFLIERDGTSAPGSTQRGPTISSDLELTVTDGPSGPVGALSSLDSELQVRSTVPLPPSSVQMIGDTVQVTVPTSLLLSTVPPGTQPAITRDAYVFEAAVPGGKPSDIAGFAPGSRPSRCNRRGSQAVDSLNPGPRPLGHDRARNAEQTW